MQDIMDMETKPLKIAILSGKGGTGKTLVSVNLAAVSKNACYIDCDVEEPNGYLFFKPEINYEKEVTVKIPLIDESRCTACRKCVEFCKFNALAFIKKTPLVFEEVCHSCGGCLLVCPEQAITEKERVIGKVQSGLFKDVTVYTGIMNPGEASGIPIIKDLLQNSIIEDKLTFIDCPPGSACIVMESIKDADYCVVVAEPTIFGTHNLNMIVELVTLFKKPFGVVLNKDVNAENPSEIFCTKNKIPILGRIAFDRELGKLNSDAKIVALETESYYTIFSDLLKKILHEAAQ